MPRAPGPTSAGGETTATAGGPRPPRRRRRARAERRRRWRRVAASSATPETAPRTDCRTPPIVEVVGAGDITRKGETQLGATWCPAGRPRRAGGEPSGTGGWWGPCGGGRRGPDSAREGD